MCTANKPLIVGDEVWLYYGALCSTNANDNWDMPDAVEARRKAWREGKADMPSGIGLAKWRLDGFLSIDAGAPGGILTTKPVVFSGRQLEINADARSGSLAVEIQDMQGMSLVRRDTHVVLATNMLGAKFYT
jgi:hypothetical protein